MQDNGVDLTMSATDYKVFVFGSESNIRYIDRPVSLVFFLRSLRFFARPHYLRAWNRLRMSGASHRGNSNNNYFIYFVIVNLPYSKSIKTTMIDFILM